MTAAPPDDIAALRAALAQAEARADAAEAEAARARAVASNTDALIASLKLEIEKLRRELYGTRSERKARLLDQLEFQLEELEATASEDELKAETAAARTSGVAAFTRKRPSRQPFPEHLPRERVVVPAPTACPCCGSDKLCKLGETIRTSRGTRCGRLSDAIADDNRMRLRTCVVTLRGIRKATAMGMAANTGEAL